MFNKNKNTTENENANVDLEESKNENVNPFAAKEESEAASAELNNEEQLEQDIQSELETLNSQYIRLAADFDNYRKRHAQEKESLLKYGAENTLKRLLPVLDTFERAKKSVVEMDDPEKIKENIDILQKQLFEALEKTGLKKIEAKGKEFDPNYHEAVMQTPTEDTPDHTVIDELQPGYTLDDRVLRPALVNVAVKP